MKRYATLTVTYDSYQARLAAGADINLDGLLKLDAAMAEIRASIPPEPPTVTVTFVNPTDHAPAGVAAVDDLVECRRCHWKPEGDDRVSRCYRCGWKHGDDTKKPWKPVPLVAPSDATATEGKAIPEPAKAAGTRPALPAPKAKQDAKREPRHVGGIHDQPSARMRVHDEPWRGHVGTVDNP